VALISLGALFVVLAFPALPRAQTPSGLPVLPGYWIPQGPAPIENGPAKASPNNEVAGAIRAVAAHPSNPDVIYVGTVNGGIWKATNGTSASPHWTPQTDFQKSLSIGALKFDSTDKMGNTLIAGIGRFSAYRRAGGPRTGLLLTTDGGSAWRAIDGGGKLVGSNISGVAMRGATIVATADISDNGSCKTFGMFRSVDGGRSFSEVSGTAGTGLPDGRAFDLAEDPGNSAVLYAPVQFVNFGGCKAGTNGVYKSTNTGATWSLVSNATMNDLFSTLQVAKVTVGANNNVYVGIVGSGLAGLFHSTDGGGTWASLDLPTIKNRFGATHFSIVADGKNPAVVYIGGQQQPGALSVLFRIDSTKAPASQVQPLDGTGTAGNTAPHADSRGMTFDADGNLLEVDDGGIYRRTSPQTNTGNWFSINGNLQVTELLDVTFDRNSGVVVGGSQDNGVANQIGTGNVKWNEASVGDAGDVAIDVTSRAPDSISYICVNAAICTREIYTAKNVLFNVDELPLTVVGGGARMVASFPTPLSLNVINPRRLVIGGSNALYESFDQGDTITELRPPIRVNIGAIVYGGNQGINTRQGTNPPNADLLYVGAGSALYKRTAPPPAELTQLTAYPGRATITGIVANEENYEFLYVTDASNVYQSVDGGTSWYNINENLPTVDVGPIESLGLFRGFPIVGTNAGVFQQTNQFGVRWNQWGVGLPHAPVYSLFVDPRSGVVFAGLLGRGAWKLSFSKPTATARQ
jgi:hypothetical protein